MGIKRSYYYQDLVTPGQSTNQTLGRSVTHSAHATHMPVLLSLQHYRQTHDAQHDRLQPRILGQKDRHVSYHGYVPQHRPNHILFPIQEVLVLGVKFCVVGCIVVSLG